MKLVELCVPRTFLPVTHADLSDAYEAHHKMSPYGKDFKTKHGSKYVATCKYLPNKNAGIWRQNITR